MSGMSLKREDLSAVEIHELTRMIDKHGAAGVKEAVDILATPAKCRARWSEPGFHWPHTCEKLEGHEGLHHCEDCGSLWAG